MVPRFSAESVYRYEGMVFSGLSGLYFLTLGPYVAHEVHLAIHLASRGSGDPKIALGLVLLAVMAAETVALPKKLRRVVAAIAEHGGEPAALFFLWMLHAVITIILYFTAVTCFGGEINDGSGDEPPGVYMFFVVVLVIKELALLIQVSAATPAKPASAHGPVEVSEEAPVAAPARPAVDRSGEWPLDLALLVFACVGHSALWGAITQNLRLAAGSLPQLIFEATMAAILFCLLYLPLRIPYWVEELAQVKDRGGRLRLTLSLLAVLIPAVASLPIAP